MSDSMGWDEDNCSDEDNLCGGLVVICSTVKNNIKTVSDTSTLIDLFSHSSKPLVSLTVLILFLTVLMGNLLLKLPSKDVANKRYAGIHLRLLLHWYTTSFRCWYISVSSANLILADTIASVLGNWSCLIMPGALEVWEYKNGFCNLFFAILA
jgi:hypothetical protein